MSHVRRPHLWTRATVDEILCVACRLFTASLGSLGYEFRPGEDVLLPLQTHTHGILWSVPHAVAVWRVAGAPSFYMMEPHACGPTGLRIDAQTHTHGVLWSVPHAVAVWRVAGAPSFYMMEPHACGPTGLRIDAQTHTHGVLWSVPHAVAVWRVAGAPSFYMMEPHATMARPVS
ncbi:Neverland [Operophtera brumata]|uniref:Neverland n=1 Tax=Operophtera brumata TaxID=104452 RepID=A0A0L7LTH4_OPEBR|nr:Neverland [Operophtera brumata]